MAQFTIETIQNSSVGTETTTAVVLEGPVQGQLVRATVAPELGMALVSLTADGVETLCVKRLPEFNSIRKGVGPLIGPHFNQWRTVPDYSKEFLSSWTHAPKLLSTGFKDPFQHGVGRYVPWAFDTATVDGASAMVRGRIRGSDTAHGLALREIQGFDFEMSVTFSLDRAGLHIVFDVKGEQPITAGLHYYYRLDAVADSTVELQAQPSEKFVNERAPQLPADWRDGNRLRIPATIDLDHAFTLTPASAGKSRARLITPDFTLDTIVPCRGPDSETFKSLILHHPAGTNYICVEPISAKDITKSEQTELHSEVLLVPKARVNPRP